LGYIARDRQKKKKKKTKRKTREMTFRREKDVLFVISKKKMLRGRWQVIIRSSIGRKSFFLYINISLLKRGGGHRKKVI